MRYPKLLTVPRCSLMLVAMMLPAVAAGDPEQGFKMSLVGGGNLDGWHVTQCEAAVEDGLLVLKSGNGFVRSDHQYQDFVLDLDWRARKPDQWDSGIYFRAELPSGARPWPKQYQVNLHQGMEGNVGGLDAAQSSGLVKAGQWNHFKLTVVGSKAELEINGQPAWKTDGIEAQTGYIGLQAEVPAGGQFEFKNINITELGHRSLFNGRNLDGWEGAASDAASCWSVVDGCLTCSGEKGTWLRSDRQYQDFNLRLEYKVSEAGNSGVYLRVDEKGNHHQGGGVEIQVLDDPAENYKKLKPYQFSGSLYAIAAASPHVGRPAGQWNSLEINCRGAHYRVTHNGVVVVDAEGKDYPELNARRKEGYLGLQNHRTNVAFRNLRIGPPQP